jgi:aryl-alcohol dehydrogenase-like predicted oxidoreductase
VSASQVAIAWAGTHGAVPIIGPRSQTQLKDNLDALTLSVEQIQRLDTVSSLDASMSARKPISRDNGNRVLTVA